MIKAVTTTFSLLLPAAFVFSQNQVVPGTVPDENSHAVPDLTVRAKDTRPGKNTDYNGAYRISNVAPGATLIFPGGKNAVKEVFAGSGGPNNLVAEAERFIDFVTVIKHQSLIVTGVVTDSHGNPVAGASVRIASTRASTGTDSAGHYRIYAASDTCSIVVEANGFWPVTEPVNGRTSVNIMFNLPPEDATALRLLRTDNGGLRVGVKGDFFNL